MTKRKRQQPRLYRIETFRRYMFDRDRGTVTEYLAAGSNRKQAIAACKMQSGEVILSIACIGNKTRTMQIWRGES